MAIFVVKITRFGIIYSFWLDLLILIDDGYLSPTVRFKNIPENSVTHSGCSCRIVDMSGAIVKYLLAVMRLIQHQQPVPDT